MQSHSKNVSSTKFLATSGADFLALCARAKRGEIVIHSVSVGNTPAEWIVEIYERPAVQSELFIRKTR